PLSALSQAALDRPFLRRPPLPTMPGYQESAVAPPPTAESAACLLLSLRLHPALRTQRAALAQPDAALSTVLRLRRAKPAAIRPSSPARRAGLEPGPAHLGPAIELPSSPQIGRA